MADEGNRSKELAVGAVSEEQSPDTAAVETDAAAPAAARRDGSAWRRAAAGPRRVIRDNPLFSIALALAVVPRVFVMLGWRPAILFKLDTYDYLWNAVHVGPNRVNPSGYSLFLAMLRPFHSLTLIATLQHLMGLAIAVMVYAVLRSWRVSRWLATVAALPVLFDPGEILLEHQVMADLLALFLMIASLALVLYRSRRSPTAPVWRLALGGLAMGASVLVRPTTLPLIVFLAIYLLVTRVGWRKAGAVLVAGALPVVAYMSWFASVNGSFNMTNSDGLFLWSRTMSFANCSVIKPPADLRALCPTAQPAPLNQPVAAKRQPPHKYLWDHNSWQWQPQPTGLVPDASAFTKANNSRAMRFAIKAITAEPFAFADVVVKETLSPFGHGDNYPLPTAPEPGMTGADARYARAAVSAYTDSDSMPFLTWRYSANKSQPYVRLMGDYQKVIFLPGPVFALILLIGLAGLFIPRRRTAAAILLWVSAVVILVLPVAEHEYTYRYAIPAVPLACMAAALAFRQLGGANDQRDGQQRDGQPGDGEQQAGPAEPKPPATEPDPA